MNENMKNEYRKCHKGIIRPVKIIELPIKHSHQEHGQQLIDNDYNILIDEELKYVEFTND